MWDLIISVPDNCLSLNFPLDVCMENANLSRYVRMTESIFLENSRITMIMAVFSVGKYVWLKADTKGNI